MPRIGWLGAQHNLAAATVHGYTTAFGWSAVLFEAGAILAPFRFGRSKPADRPAGEVVVSYR